MRFDVEKLCDSAPPTSKRGCGPVSAQSAVVSGANNIFRLTHFRRFLKILRDVSRLTVLTAKEKRIEEKKEECICPLCWRIHHNCARNAYIIESWKQQYSFLGMVHSALFNNVFKALNLFLNKYVAEI
jgi:hypothetical protein